MISVIVGVALFGTAIILISCVLHEVICIYKNPFPLFKNKDKRFGEIDKYQTRSILKDIHYDV